MAGNQICRNCGHTVEENYCPACGQRTNTGRLTWRTFIENFTSTFIGDEAYGLRGLNMRKGALMTWLTIICQPHTSISEYIRGHRRKYFNPVTLLLLLSTFYAIVFSLVGKEFTPTAKEGQNLFIWLACTYFDYAKLHPAANMLLLLPFYALALKTVFRRKSDLKYVEYLYIGIFLSIFEITLMILALPAELLIPWYSSFYMLTLPVYVYAAFVFWKLFVLRKRSAIMRTLVANILQYIYIALILPLLPTLLLVGYYLISPAKFQRDFSNLPQNGKTELIEADSTEKSAVGKLVEEALEAIGDWTLKWGGDDDEEEEEDTASPENAPQSTPETEQKE
ncbi:DUF3667 domain-containing protein [uncultured Alistipes sp.]|jgi:membrane protein|uniref:DUF3667 domain-containing protein n=1 Tax=uncultured Alistipes sp. TaxID=538949 RepID=UPI0025E8DAB7|nr:DUF3667 domain-containing protein [uncultured Alistipes sp.]